MKKIIFAFFVMVFSLTALADGKKSLPICKIHRYYAPAYSEDPCAPQGQCVTTYPEQSGVTVYVDQTVVNSYSGSTTIDGTPYKKAKALALELKSEGLCRVIVDNVAP